MKPTARLTLQELIGRLEFVPDLPRLPSGDLADVDVGSSPSRSRSPLRKELFEDVASSLTVEQLTQKLQAAQDEVEKYKYLLEAKKEAPSRPYSSSSSSSSSSASMLHSGTKRKATELAVQSDEEDDVVKKMATA